MTKVLEVVNYFNAGGIEAYVLNHVRHLDPSEFDVTILVLMGDRSPFQRAVEASGIKFIFTRFGGAWKDQAPKYRKTLSIMKEGRYDVVHSHIGLLNGPVMLAARKAGVPVRISHCHRINVDETGSVFRKFYYNVLYRILIRKHSTIKAACGEEAGKALYRTDDFVVLRNGLDVNRFQSLSSSREKFEISPDCRVYGNVSRFDSGKNLVFAVDVFNEIRKKDRSAVLILGGADGDRKKEVLSRIEGYGLQDAVRVTGSVADMTEVYSCVDCYIFPSLYEGLVFALLETQACGIPAVASDRIPNEVDLGLDLITFLPLEASASVWADVAMSLGPSASDKDVIRRRFDDLGYSIEASAAILSKIYAPDLQESR